MTANLKKTSAVEIVNDESELLVSFAGTDFEEAVSRIQSYIAQGDVFQVNLSVRQSKKINCISDGCIRSITYFQSISLYGLH